MGKSLLIFFIWLAIAVVGVIAKSRKKGDKPLGEQPRQRHVTLEDILEKIEQKEEPVRSAPAAEPAAPKAAPKAAPAPEPAAEPMPEEGISVTKPVASPAPEDGKAMDFDPVDMVIYSEIMNPGYEKY